MPTLIHQRCFNHAAREAVACCPECGRYFCRECVTEHADRMLCATCLRLFVKPPLTRRGLVVAVWRTLQFAAGLLVLWLFFFWLGEALLSIPSAFHEGTIWQDALGSEP